MIVRNQPYRPVIVFYYKKNVTIWDISYFPAAVTHSERSGTPNEKVDEIRKKNRKHSQAL